VTERGQAAGGGATAPALLAVSLRGLTRRLGGELVLRGLDLDIAAGRVVVLRGSNGAGKTTLLKVLTTRLRPTTGGGAVFGNDLLRQADDVRASVGFLGVHGGNYPMLTARENLVLAAALAAASGGGPLAVAGDSAVDEALTLVGLADASRKLVRTFSSGMKKRLGLARMVLGDPRLWLLDEPYAALDEDAKELVDRLVIEARLRGRTVLMASHESDRTELAPDAVLRLEGGRIYAGGLGAARDATSGSPGTSGFRVTGSATS